MKMHIGENIRALRKKKGFSQAQLAERLNVSFQAVSKWENGIALPDITLVPMLAQIFGVTADELLSNNSAEEMAEIESYVSKAYKLRETDPKEGRRVLEEALLKYPDNELLLNNLLYCVNYTEDPDETVRISTRLINRGASGEIKYDALRFLAYAHKAKGDTESAVATLEQVPELYFTKLSEMAFILSGEPKYKAADKQKWISLETLIQMLWKLAEYHIEKGENEKAVDQTEKALAIIKIFADESENFKPYEEFLTAQLDNDNR